jgi:bifunctional lysine-specific demethylase and histidyl-hydroxylase NO66
MNGSREPALGRLVGDAQAFVSEAWARRPLHHPGSGETYEDLLSMDDVDQLISSSSLRLPAFRMVKDGTTLPTSTYTRSARIGSATATGVADPRRIYQLFHDGATIVLQGMHRYWPPLLRFCRELDLELGHPTQVNAYVTPPGARGLAVHHDSHDVFVLQAFGRKHWEVFEPPGGDGIRPGPWRRGSPDSRDPTMTIEMQPGDCLYLPEGTPHAARTQESVSGHLTIGVLSTTWREVIRHLLRLAEEEPAFRERLPVGSHRDPEGLRSGVEHRLRDLGRWLEKVDAGELAARTIRAFLTSRQPLLGGAFHDALRVDALTDESRVRRRTGAICHLEPAGDRLLAFLGDRELRMPAGLEPAMRRILDREEFPIHDLANVLDEESRLVLVRRLVREGLLEVPVDG